MAERGGNPALRKLLGVVLVVVLVAVVAGVVGGYRKAFTPSVDVTVLAERAGLQMNEGAAVNVRGLKVGEVREVSPHGEGAAMEVAIDPDQARYIPANVTATIGAPTVFGAKYIDLKAPAEPAPARITDGAVIRTDVVVTEGNTLLEGLNTLLASIDVAKLNSALGGLSTGLQGNGDRLGRMVVQTNGYLRKLNPAVPTLARDLAAAAPVTDTYAAATPDLVTALDNLRVTSGTLEDREPALARLLTEVAEISGNAQHLLEDNGGMLDSLVSRLRPTTALLDRYSPMFPCLFASTNQIRQGLERIIGYEYPGIHTFTSFLPSQQGYIYPRDLPKVGVTAGPTCYGAPITPRPDVPFPHVIFDDGWLGFVPSDAVTLGGPMGVPAAPPPLPRPPAPADLGVAAPAVPKVSLPSVGGPAGPGEPAAPAGPDPGSGLLGGLGDAARKGLPR